MRKRRIGGEKQKERREGEGDEEEEDWGRETGEEREGER